MNKRIRIVIICLIFLLFVPQLASAAQKDFLIKYLVFLEEREIEEVSEGNISIVLGSADINSDVNGSVVVVLGKAVINANVSGDVVSVFGDVDILNDSQITGNLVSVGKLSQSDGTEIYGSKFVFNADIISLFKSNGILINISILYALIVLTAGLILITVFTDRYRVMSYSMRKNLSRRMILGGLGVLSITILLAFFIFFFVAPILYLIFLMLANIISSIYAGAFIIKENTERSTIYLQFFVGHILISILKIVPLIFLPVGSYTALLIYGICYILFELAMASFGIGTAIDTSYGKKS